MGRDKPLSSEEDASNWLDEEFPQPPWWWDMYPAYEKNAKISEFNSRGAEFITEIDRLALGYGLDEGSVWEHILVEGKIALPAQHKVRFQQEKSGRPYLELRIYHPQSLKLLNPEIFHDQLPGWRMRLGSERAKKRERPMSIHARVRTWFIHYLSRRGGGPISQQEALDRWNKRFPQYATSLRGYQIERDRLLSDR